MHTMKKGFTILEGIAIGGFLGLLAGTLFAPRTGKEIRSRMKRKAGKTIEEVKGVCSDTEMKAKALLKDAKHRARDWRKEAIHQFTGAWDDAKRLLS